MTELYKETSPVEAKQQEGDWKGGGGKVLVMPSCKQGLSHLICPEMSRLNFSSSAKGIHSHISQKGDTVRICVSLEAADVTM